MMSRRRTGAGSHGSGKSPAAAEPAVVEAAPAAVAVVVVASDPAFMDAEGGVYDRFYRQLPEADAAKYRDNLQAISNKFPDAEEYDTYVDFQGAVIEWKSAVVHALRGVKMPTRTDAGILPVQPPTDMYETYEQFREATARWAKICRKKIGPVKPHTLERLAILRKKRTPFAEAFVVPTSFLHLTASRRHRLPIWMKVSHGSSGGMHLFRLTPPAPSTRVHPEALAVVTIHAPDEHHAIRRRTEAASANVGDGAAVEEHVLDTIARLVAHALDTRLRNMVERGTFTGAPPTSLSRATDAGAGAARTLTGEFRDLDGALASTNMRDPTRATTTSVGPYDVANVDLTQLQKPQYQFRLTAALFSLEIRARRAATLTTAFPAEQLAQMRQEEEQIFETLRQQKLAVADKLSLVTGRIPLDAYEVMLEREVLTSVPFKQLVMGIVQPSFMSMLGLFDQHTDLLVHAKLAFLVRMALHGPNGQPLLQGLLASPDLMMLHWAAYALCYGCEAPVQTEPYPAELSKMMLQAMGREVDERIVHPVFALHYTMALAAAPDMPGTYNAMVARHLTQLRSAIAKSLRSKSRDAIALLNGIAHKSRSVSSVCVFLVEQLLLERDAAVVTAMQHKDISFLTHYRTLARSPVRVVHMNVRRLLGSLVLEPWLTYCIGQYAVGDAVREDLSFAPPTRFKSSHTAGAAGGAAALNASGGAGGSTGSPKRSDSPASIKSPPGSPSVEGRSLTPRSPDGSTRPPWDASINYAQWAVPKAVATGGHFTPHLPAEVILTLLIVMFRSGVPSAPIDRDRSFFGCDLEVPGAAAAAAGGSASGPGAIGSGVIAASSTIACLVQYGNAMPDKIKQRIGFLQERLTFSKLLGTLAATQDGHHVSPGVASAAVLLAELARVYHRLGMIKAVASGASAAARSPNLQIQSTELFFMCQFISSPATTMTGFAARRNVMYALRYLLREPGVFELLKAQENATFYATLAGWCREARDREFSRDAFRLLVDIVRWHPGALQELVGLGHMAPFVELCGGGQADSVTVHALGCVNELLRLSTAEQLRAHEVAQGGKVDAEVVQADVAAFVQHLVSSRAGIVFHTVYRRCAAWLDMQGSLGGQPPAGLARFVPPSAPVLIALANLYTTLSSMPQCARLFEMMQKSPSMGAGLARIHSMASG